MPTQLPGFVASTAAAWSGTIEASPVEAAGSSELRG
jgi:hypothetical protein